ncbi:hypothetical protein AAE478_010294 [Parahypoxylon ruwenzoriense]
MESSSSVPFAEGSTQKFLDVPYDQRWEPLKPVIIRIYMEERNKLSRLAERMSEEYSFNAQSVLRPINIGTILKKWDIKKRTTAEEKDAIINAVGKRRQRDGVSTSNVTVLQGGVEKAVDKKQIKRYINDSIRHAVPLVSRPGMSAVTWLHDFWMFSFMTVKYWGKGPKTWILPLINFKSFGSHPIPSSPHYVLEQGQPGQSSSPMGTALLISSPTQLCRWSIHYMQSIAYKYFPSPLPPENVNFEDQYDIDDESSWSNWPEDGSSRSLATTLNQGLHQNLFSTVHEEELPLAAGQIVKAVEESPGGFQAEAFGFAIISRNLEALSELIYEQDAEVFSTIFPFHLAARFLDGAKSCCLVMDLLLENSQGPMSIGVNYINGSGHTVLDTFFVTILRSHSNILRRTLINAFDGQFHYPGQDVDPCGRWNIDSPCIRKLYASGTPTIPVQWKHMFCHTSVQAITHCISSIFSLRWRPNINTPSGLCIKRCPHCGMQLQVGPLHSLVLTAFDLANNSMPDETLYGMVACLVCLLTWGADPCNTVRVSIPLLLGHELSNECQHPYMNAAELASSLLSESDTSWNAQVRLGSDVLTAILDDDIAKGQSETTNSGVKLAASKRPLDSRLPDADSIDSSHNDDENSSCGHLKYYDGELEDPVYCGNQRLGKVWAVIQAELLTYRRLGVGDPWLSPRFDMETLLVVLKNNDDRYIGHLVGDVDDIGKHRLRPHFRCGLFKAGNLICPGREEVCASYYANLDDWGRTTFIPPN